MKPLKPLTMPKWGIEMVEGTIAEWNVAEGADFAKGDLLTLIETDKITNEYETEFAGKLARIVVPAGETKPVGALLAVFAEAGASIDANAVDQFIAAYRPSGAAAAAASSALPAAVGTPPPTAPAIAPSPISETVKISPAARDVAIREEMDVNGINGSGRGGRITYQDVAQALLPANKPAGGAALSVAPSTAELDQMFASPLAKRIAVQNFIDLTNVPGTGPRGRITKGDVLTRVGQIVPPPVIVAPSLPPPGPGVEIVRMSAMRKAIARQLSLSKSTIPHFYLRNAARIDALNALRIQAKRATGTAPSINDYLIRAVAMALRAHPDINVQIHGDEIHRSGQADIAVAVATDKGLLTPIIRAADTKSVASISAEVRALADRARAGRLSAEEFQGGSFSLSNLGMFGIDAFDAIINPPQGAILAVGAARQEALAENHALTFATRLRLSLSCDHRAIDGAVGARFLAELTRLIEAPEELTA